MRTPSTSSLTEIGSSSEQIVTFTPDAPGQYVLSLTVDNNVYDSQPDLVLVGVQSDEPAPPVADAGDDLVSE